MRTQDPLISVSAFAPDRRPLPKEPDPRFRSTDRLTRSHRIARIRRQIAEGSYITPDKLDHAINRMVRSL